MLYEIIILQNLMKLPLFVGILTHSYNCCRTAHLGKRMEHHYYLCCSRFVFVHVGLDWTARNQITFGAYSSFRDIPVNLRNHEAQVVFHFHIHQHLKTHFLELSFGPLFGYHL